MIAETAADARDVLVEGESGVLSVHPKDFRPHYEPSKRRLTWPNGAVATLYNAVEPDQLRGPQHDLAWCDELAKWRYVRDTWDQLQFGLRLGTHPRQIVTTTPRPLPLLKELLAASTTIVTRGSTFENRANLAASFLTQIESRYAGTRLGRQELEAEILDDMPGALWARSVIDETRVKDYPPLKRVAIAIDPPVTSGEDADECGIIAAGIDEYGAGFVIGDRSSQGDKPSEWARRAVQAYEMFDGDCIVAEVNNGGEMIEEIIRQVAPNIPVKSVRATRGKFTRAEPVAALYEQRRVHHVGSFPKLEDQMCAMTPDFDPAKAGYSPDRLDALVWAMTELMVGPRAEPRIRSF